MIEKRINYQVGGGADMGGVADSQGNTGPGASDDPGTSTGGAKSQAMGMGGKQKGGTFGGGTVAGGTGGPDFSAVGQFSQFGRNLMQQNLTPSFLDRVKGLGGTVLGGILGAINPALGFAYRGIGSLQNLGKYDTLADFFAGEFGKDKDDDDEDQVQTFDLGPTRNPMASFTPKGIVNTPVGLDFINAPQNYVAPSAPTTVDFLSNAMAEVTQKDIDASKAKGFNMMDYDTARSIGMISPNVTEYEFNQLQQGNITEPGTYVG